MPTLEKLIDGFKLYRATAFESDRKLLEHQIRANILPETLVITSPDFHIAPEILTTSNPGDMYVMRMKGGIVPPFDANRVSGFTATLEFGIVNLRVKNVVVLGHSHNDGLQMLLDGAFGDNPQDPLRNWLGYADDVCAAVKRDLGSQPRDIQEKALELETVVMNIRNLFTYPWVSERVNQDGLEIYGWHFDIESGTLLGYMPATGAFEPFN